VSGALAKFRYAAELKNAPLSSRPRSWTLAEKWWTYPSVAARLAYLPNAMWTLGFSASTGSYLRPSAVRTLAPGFGRGDYREILFGQDVGFAWHHWQVWAELYATRFEFPRVGDADLVAGYVEAKYKFTPQFFGSSVESPALRHDPRCPGCDVALGPGRVARRRRARLPPHPARPGEAAVLA
jgi:hypothetical protein